MERGKKLTVKLDKEKWLPRNTHFSSTHYYSALLRTGLAEVSKQQHTARYYCTEITQTGSWRFSDRERTPPSMGALVMGVHWDYNRLVASQASFIYTQGQNAKRSKKNLKSTTNSSHPKDKKSVRIKQL